MKNFTQKLRYWLKRYIPAEISGTAVALLGAVGAHHYSKSAVASAIGGDIGEAVGYYAYFIVHESRRYYEIHRQRHPLHRIGLTVLHTFSNLLVEFGPAEALDALLLRPVFMYAGQRLTHQFIIGILVGKVAADLIFYAIVIASHEAHKRYKERR